MIIKFRLVKANKLKPTIIYYYINYISSNLKHCYTSHIQTGIRIRTEFLARLQRAFKTQIQCLIASVYCK